MSSGRVLVETVRIPADGVRLTGDLATPGAALGTVVFAHGSGSSRLSPRNRHVAEVLQSAGLATLLVDLLTPDEEAEDAITRRLRFDIPLLVGWLVDVVEDTKVWRRSQGTALTSAARAAGFQTRSRQLCRLSRRPVGEGNTRSSGVTTRGRSASRSAATGSMTSTARMRPVLVRSRSSPWV